MQIYKLIPILQNKMPKGMANTLKLSGENKKCDAGKLQFQQMQSAIERLCYIDNSLIATAAKM